MNEVFAMWKKTRMVVLVAFSAGLYATLLVPFKGFVLIPSITEIRPASVLPPVLGLLFGPAGAWGAAIGNLIGDFFGSLGVGSLFGFIGNFMFAYVPYKLWLGLGLVPGEDMEPDLKSRRKVIAFSVVAILGSFACALVIAWGLEILRLVPFAALGSIISLNNSLPSVVLGIPLVMGIYPRIKKWDLLWTDIMDPEDVPVPGGRTSLGSFLMTICIVAGLFGGFIAAFKAGQGFLYEGFGTGGDVGSAWVIAIGGLGSIGLVLSSFLQTMPDNN
ncbi:MAG: QueT transporter family protein [Synergistaceae bacterium]|nr:QueT transporter family protein [Synergistota bacterium]NLM71600.1 QueT transporter family protein [Synergistaceae bacterium]